MSAEGAAGIKKLTISRDKARFEWRDELADIVDDIKPWGLSARKCKLGDSELTEASPSISQSQNCH
jgi:hypothetical protein